MGEPIGGSGNLDANSTTVLPREESEAELTEGRSSPQRRPRRRREHLEDVDHDTAANLALSRQCTCGGILKALPPPRNFRRHLRPVREFVFYCRSCKKQVVFISSQSQRRHCAAMVLSALLVCVLGTFLIQKIRHHSSIYMVGAVATALSFTVLTCRVSLRAFLREIRNQRRYPVVEPSP